MKLQLLSILLILPSLLIPSFAEEVGSIEWSQDHYFLDEFPKITITDNDINSDSTIINFIEIDVWSETDAGGIDLILNETGIDTGIFEASITISTTEESQDTILQITDGDYITAEYGDSTLPIPPYNVSDKLDIAVSSYVSNIEPNPFILTTDKSQYHKDETVFVSGEVIKFESMKSIYFTVISPNEQQPILVLQERPNSDRTFNASFQIDNSFIDVGIYTMNVNFAGYGVETTFEIIPSPIQLFTDKPSYNQGETILISGEVSNHEEGGILSFLIISPDENILAVFQSTINPDKTFSYIFEINEFMVNVGTYVIEVYYENDVATTTFELLPPYIKIFTDKQSYNKIDTIHITGETTIPTDETDEVLITIYDYDNNIISKQSHIPIIDNKFSHNIVTDDVIWNNYIGDITIEVELLEYTDSTTVSYSYYPILSLESIYDMAGTNDIRINNLYNTIETLELENIQKGTEIISLSDTVISLQTQLTELHSIIEDFLDSKIILPLAAPIITSFTIHDPDDLDTIYSRGDVLTIQFDSPTNMPGGNTKQQKFKVNEMFEFSDTIGMVYEGKWIAPNTFEITIKGGMDDAKLMINQTTVTPTGITQILPYNSHPSPSNATSPVLDGDFGSP